MEGVKVSKNPTGSMIVLDSNTIKQILVAHPDCLDQRERQIVEMRHMDEGSRKTLQYIGEMFGVSRERERQMEKRAIRKLRHPARLKGEG